VLGIVTLYYDIPEELHRRLKVEAATRGTTLKALVIEALERVLDESDGKAANGRR
jgi:predicted HicB family RNase H-like nuclease